MREFLEISRFEARNWIFFGLNALLSVTGSWLTLQLAPENPDLQLYVSRIFFFFLLGQIFYWLFLRLEQTKQKFWSFLFRENSAWNLGFFRLIFMLAVFGSVKGWLAHDLALWTQLPARDAVGLPFLGEWVQMILVDAHTFALLVRITMILALLSALGLFTRISLSAYVLLGLYVWGVPFLYGKLNHVHIVLWFPFFLALFPSGAAFSLDSLLLRLLKKKPIPRQKSPAYGIPLQLILLQIGVIYTFSGLHKIWDSGFAWALNGNMVNQMWLEWWQNYGEIPELRLDKFPVLLKFLGLGVIFWELLALYLLFHRRLRWLVLLGGMALHNASGYFMYINFQMLQRAYVAFIDWVGVWNWIRLKIFRRKPRPSASANSSPEISSSPFRLAKVGLGLVLINAFCGLLGIHAWPFSAYPSYSRLVPVTYDHLHFELADFEGRKMDPDQLGFFQGFRKESILPLEDDVLEKLAEGDSLGARELCTAYLRKWELAVPAFALSPEIKVFAWQTDLNPDRWSTPLRSDFLFSYVRDSQAVAAAKTRLKESEPRFFYQNKLISGLRAVTFVKQSTDCPPGLSGVFRFFGPPGDERNTDWMSLVATMNVAIEGRRTIFSFQDALDNFRDLAPHFPVENASFEYPEGQWDFLEELKTWAVDWPEEVRDNEAAYAAAWQEFHQKSTSSP
ncbi:MAG: hypothetical protein H6581_19710 [Bacteroidia bacterium]|nr:hypothetical protein [Bacteroidia bacterium]